MEDSSYPLTSIDIAALRKCDRVVFRHVGGASQIEAIKEPKKSAQDPFAQEQRQVIPCGWRLTDYSSESAGQKIAGYGDERRYNFSAFEMMHGPSYCEHWATVVSLLRPGDVLTLHWARGAFNTQGLRDVSMFGDRLSLDVDRKDKRLSFFVDMSVCPDNTARMIRKDSKRTLPVYSVV